ncbi:MAG: serpin family protein [Candidatus Aegiribacteria sp.]|nr:serpin family protein [Candidatus Aegiribacteria sp.]
MGRLISILSATVLISLLCMCSSGQAPAVSSSNIPRITEPDVNEEDLRELASGNCSFAFNLYKNLAENDGNIFFSPYSISTALAMTYAGAEGITEEEMADVLKFSLPENRLHPSFNLLDQKLAASAIEDSTFSLHIMNALWGQTGYTFLPEFLGILAANYGAGIRVLDFSADPEECREIINEWVMEQTEGKIENLIPPDILTSATKLVLTNAIYFNAQWLFQFDEMGTHDRSFNLIDGDQVTVPMMNQTEHFHMATGDGYMAVELLYSNGKASMLVIVPDENYFFDVEERLGNDLIAEITGNLRDANLYLSMPRFETVSSFQLEEVLPEMGMPSAFGVSADFSGMDGTISLFIASVIHKAFVSVDEKGTEAAAATAVIMQKLNGGSSVEFNVNRPFIYLIRDRGTGTILFIGRVLNPLE